MAALAEPALPARLPPARDGGGPLNEPAWLEEEAAAIWSAARGELGTAPGSGEEGEARRLFDEASAIARRWYHHRVSNRPGLDTEAELRQLYAREVNCVFREKRYASMQAVTQRWHLAPEDCRDERVDAILTEAKLAELREHGLVVIDWAMRPKEVLAVRKEAEALDAGGALRPIPAFSGYNVRGDRATWIDAGESLPKGTAGGEALFGAVRLLRGLALPLQAGGGFGPLRVPPRAMLALYPGKGAGYRAHKDSDEEDPRSVTCILYLQTLAWNSDRDGGELSAVPPGELRPRRIEPKGGRLVIFNSRTVVHEVLPSRGQRMALTIWLSRAPADAEAGEGAKAPQAAVAAGAAGAGETAAGATPAAVAADAVDAGRGCSVVGGRAAVDGGLVAGGRAPARVGVEVDAGGGAREACNGGSGGEGGASAQDGSASTGPS